MNKTKFFLIICTLALFTLLKPNFVSEVHAQTNVLNIHLFYSKTCPHCTAEEKFLNEVIMPKYPNVKINKYEVTTNRENLFLLEKVSVKLNADASRVPFLVIGSDYIVGYYDNISSGTEIDKKISTALKENSKDVVSEIIMTSNTKQPKDENANKPLKPSDQQDKKSLIFNAPFIGTTDLHKLSLPAVTFVIGLLDGINPCALWVLLFIISLTIGTKDKKKMWLYGGTFIFASGFVYFLFLATWLNFFLFIGYANIVRVLIGLLALGVGIYYLRDYIRNRKGGCKVMENEKRQKLFYRIKEIVLKKSLPMALLGIVILAFAVNVVELLCSAGLPAVYTKLLAMTPMPTWQYYSYLLAYIFFFLLTDIVVFAIAMVTLETTGVKQKFANYSHLLGGILMLLIGIAMLLKPELLMFG
jgi:glutaredoxin